MPQVMSKLASFGNCPRNFEYLPSGERTVEETALSAQLRLLTRAICSHAYTNGDAVYRRTAS